MSELIIRREQKNDLLVGTELPTDLPFEYPFPKKRNKEQYKCFSIYKDGEAIKIQTNYFIGVDWIVTGKTALYVQPKLNDEFGETNYLKMLFSALKHPEISKYTDELFDIKFDEPFIDIKQQKDLLTPLLVVQFLRVLQNIVRKGLKQSYYRIEKNLHCRVKGKIMVGQTIKQNLLKNKPLNTYCTFDEFGINGLENRLLKKALLFVRRYIPTLKIPDSEKYTTEVFNYVMPAFELVSDEVSLNDIKHSKINAFYKEYEEGLRLAKLILKRFGYNISNTQQTKIKTPPFWIDMSKLFELYVLGLLKSEYGNDIKFQFQANYGQLDYLLLDKKTVVDAKYKTYYKEDFRIMEQWKRDNVISDIRQLSGYYRDTKVLSAIEEVNGNFVPECLIIYPEALNSEAGLQQKIDFLTKAPINEFLNFYKVAVKLPMI